MSVDVIQEDSTSVSAAHDAAAIHQLAHDLRSTSGEWYDMTPDKRFAFLEELQTKHESLLSEHHAAMALQRGIPADAGLQSFNTVFGLTISDYVAFYRGLSSVSSSGCSSSSSSDISDKNSKSDFINKVKDGVFNPVTVPHAIPVIRTSSDGKKVLKLKPNTALESAVMAGDVLECYLEPDSTGQDLSMDRRLGAGVRAVFMPGNYEGSWDILHTLFTDGRVALVKTHPVSETSARVTQRIFQPLVDAGFVAFVEGGLIEARAVLQSDIDDLCFTGNWLTHDNIVWGPDGEERTRRKAENDPVFDKPVLSELGGVGTATIVPGEWTDAEMRHVCEVLVYAKLFNGGHICMSPQVLVTHRGWPQREKFLSTLRKVITDSEQPACYYPQYKDRLQQFEKEYVNKVEKLDMHKEAFCDDYSFLFATDVDPKSAFVTDFEMFGPAWAEVALPLEGYAVSDTASFLDAALEFVNGSVRGNLSGGIFIDPRTQVAHADAFERFVDGIEVGVVGINTWGAAGAGHGVACFGAHPGNTLSDVCSGIGKLQNCLRLDKPCKIVLRSPMVSPAHMRAGRHGASAGAANLKKMHRLNMFAARPGWWRFVGVASASLLGV